MQTELSILTLSLMGWNLEMGVRKVETHLDLKLFQQKTKGYRSVRFV